MESVDKELRTMNTVQIDKAVTEINQKIAHSSMKKTNINNPIKVLVIILQNSSDFLKNAKGFETKKKVQIGWI